MAPTGSSMTTAKKRKSTTSTSTVAAKKSKSNLGTSTRNGSVSVQTEEEEEDYAWQGVDRIIISDEEGNVTSEKDIGSQASDVMEEEDDEVELSM